jgi:vitamin B12 transporter
MMAAAMEHGKPVERRRCPRNGMRTRFASPETGPSSPTHHVRPAGTLAAERKTAVNRLSIAGLVGLAALGARAQGVPLKTFVGEPVVVTATREIGPVTPTLRDTIVITREQLDDVATLSLPEALQRLANAELRANGGAGQPAGIFLRGASPAQTLVLIDGQRAGSAGTGTTAIESLPLEMIERIEIVKGPMSSLYGSDAMGGVIQIFTRGKDVPHLFGAAAYGTDNDRRLSAGVSTVDGNASASLAFGGRKVDPPSATNARAGPFVFSSDRDPYDNAFANARLAYRLWTGETIALEGFGSKSRTHFDSGNDNADDRSDQTVQGYKLSSSNHFTDDWASKLSIGTSRDKLVFHGSFEGFFETQQNQGSWINEWRTGAGSVVAGYEEVHQKVKPDKATNPFTGEDIIAYSTAKRRVRSVFASVNEGWQGNRLEANARRDDYDDLGAHNTGAVSYGFEWSPALRFSVTAGRGFRAPTFNDLYAPADFGGNPNLRPEKSKSTEAALAGRAGTAQWRVTAFDNRFEDLILYDAQSNQVINVGKARARGVEATIDAAWLGIKWHATATGQRTEDEETGARLPSRAERFGSIDMSRDFAGAWNAGLTVTAVGERFDSRTEDPGLRLPSYAVVDARVRYRFNKMAVAELTARNLGDKRYETAVGYDAPRRGVLLSVRFDAF